MMTGRAALAGYVVTGVGLGAGVPPLRPTGGLAVLGAGESVGIDFLRPPPPLPGHSWARKIARLKPRFGFLGEHKKWLEANACNGRRDLIWPAKSSG